MATTAITARSAHSPTVSLAIKRATPSLALAIWQAQIRQRWWVLLLSLTLYLPLLFTLVVCFWPFALLPKGLLSAALLHLGHTELR